MSISRAVSSESLQARPVWVLDYRRTPFGKRGGFLGHVRTDDLAARPIEALRRDWGSLDGGLLDEVVMGNTNGAGEENRNVGRMAVLLSGLSETIPGMTVNRLCASGGESILTASRVIRSGDADVVIAGGVESMSRAPFVVAPIDASYPRELKLHQTAVGWRMTNPAFESQWTEPLGLSADRAAQERRISRSEQDDWAVRSHEESVRAYTGGFGRDSLVSVANAGPRIDEGVRDPIDPRVVGELKPVFDPEGTVTAGNSSPLSDGAGAILLASDTGMRRLGTEGYFGQILGGTTVGVLPHRFTDAPALAVNKLLSRTGLTVSDIAAWEVQEAFAAVVLGVLQDLPGLDPRRVNMSGGAIAKGHPLGASFLRAIGDLCLNLRERGGGYGVATACVGVGMGQAVLVRV